MLVSTRQKRNVARALSLWYSIMSLSVGKVYVKKKRKEMGRREERAEAKVMVCLAAYDRKSDILA